MHSEKNKRIYKPYANEYLYSVSKLYKTNIMITIIGLHIPNYITVHFVYRDLLVSVQLYMVIY